MVNFGPEVNPPKPKSEKSIMHRTVVSQVWQTCRTAARPVWQTSHCWWWRRSAYRDICQSR